MFNAQNRLTLFLLFATNAWAGLGSHVVHTRYFGHPNFSSNTTIRYTLNSNGNYSSHSAPIMNHYSDCEILLNEQQRFPIGLMVETGYVPAEEALKEILSAGNFYPGQINFFEMMTGKVIEGFHVEDEKIEAALWTVSGQTWKSPTNTNELVLLPWQKEKHFRTLAARLDRTKYKFVFEWGRAAQSEKGQIDYLLSMAATSNYRELKALGGNLEDAYVMFYACDQRHTDIYLKRHPGRQWEKDAPELKPGESLFLVPLSEMMAADKYPPSLASGEIQQIKNLLENQLNEPQILDFLIEYNKAHWVELDSCYPEATAGPIVIQDFTTKLMPERIAVILDRMGVSRNNGILIANFLSTVSPERHSANVGQYRDVSDTQAVLHTLKRKQAIQISNLDAVSAKRDPYYIPITLLGALGYEGRVMSQYMEPVAGVSPLVLGMLHFHQQNIEFAISTFDPEIAAAIEKWKPDSVKTYRMAHNLAPHEIELFALNQPWYQDAYTKEIRTYYFSVKRLEDILNDYRFDLSVLFVLNPGVWQSHRQLSNFSVF